MQCIRYSLLKIKVYNEIEIQSVRIERSVNHVKLFGALKKGNCIISRWHDFWILQKKFDIISKFLDYWTIFFANVASAHCACFFSRGISALRINGETKPEMTNPLRNKIPHFLNNFLFKFSLSRSDRQKWMHPTDVYFFFVMSFHCNPFGTEESRRYRKWTFEMIFHSLLLTRILDRLFIYPYQLNPYECALKNFQFTIAIEHVV